MTLDLQTVLDVLDKHGIVKENYGQCKLFVHEPRALHSFIRLDLDSIDVDEKGIHILLKEVADNAPL